MVWTGTTWYGLLSCFYGRSLSLCIGPIAQLSTGDEDLLKGYHVQFDTVNMTFTFHVLLEYVGLSADGNFDPNFNLGLVYTL